MKPTVILQDLELLHEGKEFCLWFGMKEYNWSFKSKWRVYISLSIRPYGHTKTRQYESLEIRRLVCIYTLDMCIYWIYVLTA